MKTTQIVLLLFTIVTISGCGIERRNPSNVKYFLLDVERPQTEASVNTDSCLRIRPCRMAASFAGRSLVYRMSAVIYEQDYYNLFLTSPESQITTILQSWFHRVGFSECVSGSASDKTQYILETKIQTFCGDFSTPTMRDAVVQMVVTVTRHEKENTQQTLVMEKAYTARIPLPTNPTAADVVQGLSQALTQILRQAEKELAGLM